MNPAITAAIISAGASILGGMFGGKKGSQTTTFTPADLPESDKRIVDMRDVFFTDQNYPLPGRFSQDEDYRRQVAQDMINATRENKAGYLESLGDMTRNIEGTKLFGNIGGNKVNFFPKAAYKEADWRRQGAQDIFTANEAQAIREQQTMNPLAPNNAFFNMLQYLDQLYSKAQDRSYQTATQDVTQKVSGGMDLPNLLKSLTPLFTGSSSQQSTGGYQQPPYDEEDYWGR